MRYYTFQIGGTYKDEIIKQIGNPSDIILNDRINSCDEIIKELTFESNEGQNNLGISVKEDIFFKLMYGNIYPEKKKLSFTIGYLISQLGLRINYPYIGVYGLLQCKTDNNNLMLISEKSMSLPRYIDQKIRELFNYCFKDIFTYDDFKNIIDKETTDLLTVKEFKINSRGNIIDNTNNIVDFSVIYNLLNKPINKKILHIFSDLTTELLQFNKLLKNLINNILLIFRKQIIMSDLITWYYLQYFQIDRKADNYVVKIVPATEFKYIKYVLSSPLPKKEFTVANTIKIGDKYESIYISPIDWNEEFWSENSYKPDIANMTQMLSGIFKLKNTKPYDGFNNYYLSLIQKDFYTDIFNFKNNNLCYNMFNDILTLNFSNFKFINDLINEHINSVKIPFIGPTYIKQNFWMCNSDYEKLKSCIHTQSKTCINSDSVSFIDLIEFIFNIFNDIQSIFIYNRTNTYHNILYPSEPYKQMEISRIIEIK